MAPDLTPFGFTSTENLVYTALLELGPSSGYAVAKTAGIARANAYQALDGLVSKGAAALVAQEPRRYRAVQPRALLARIVDAQAGKLDRLEAQVMAQDSGGADDVVSLVGLRSLQEVATRTVAGAEAGEVRCAAPAAFLTRLVPAFRKRLADGSRLAVWTIGPAEGFPLELEGEIPSAASGAYFRLEPVLIVAPGSAIAGTLGDGAAGYWTSKPLLVGLVAAALDRLNT